MHQLVDVTRRSDHHGYTVRLSVAHRDGNTSEPHVGRIGSEPIE
jgi:hypothetical protein